MKAEHTIVLSGVLVGVLIISVIVTSGPASVSLILAIVLAIITFGQFAYSAWPTLYAKMVTKFPRSPNAEAVLSLMKKQDLAEPSPHPLGEAFRMRDPSIPLKEGGQVVGIPAIRPGTGVNARGYLKKASGEIEWVYEDSVIVAPAYLDLHIMNAGPGVATRIKCTIRERKGGGYIVDLSYYAILGRFFRRQGRFEFNQEGEWLDPESHPSL